MLEHPLPAGVPATRECPDCGTLASVAGARNGKPRQYALDATGRVGEVMPGPIPEHLLAPGAPRIAHLRPVGGGCEWDVPADSVTPCTADGTPLPAPAETP